MSDSAMLITTDLISDSDMRSMGLELDAVECSQRNGGFQLARQDGNVWVSRQIPEFFAQACEQEDLNEWQNALGGRPVGAIEIQLGHGKDSRSLYQDVVCAFARKWNVVLVDLNGKMVDRASALRLV
jgi:hypothetical protein